MRRRKIAPLVGLPMMMAELGLNSVEVIARRTLMMATRTCSPAEYRRMVHEKMAAAAASMRHLSGRSGLASPARLLAPWQIRAKANAKRLRRR
jgi:hypothetical protein